ncbi:hypothetical protein [Magnetospirillum sp. UT-4]|uniref:hypothetical protein n=1 Tax=Magnetospirillum sp. UT-4 TaxID=2681467 RepID=UPI00157312CF|nr:hypothetical protein [Magnetospirillum sp. UT-4]
MNEEIEQEAERLIARHGTQAVAVANECVERARASGDMRAYDAALMVLTTIERSQQTS